VSTTDTETTTIPAIVDAYFDLWRETDAGARAGQIAEVFTEDGRHVDPNADARGHEDLAAMMAAVHAHFPGLGMERTTTVDVHNDQLRFGWTLTGPDGTPIVTGIDVGELAADGRLRRIAGFWGELATA
jgi:hypothetical protein